MVLIIDEAYIFKAFTLSIDTELKVLFIATQNDKIATILQYYKNLEIEFVVFTTI